MAHQRFKSLVAPEKLPRDFFLTEHSDEEGCRLWEDGDDTVVRTALRVRHAADTYNACWLVYEHIDHDFIRGQIIEVTENDFSHGRINFSSDIRRRATLPIFFTTEQLAHLLATEPDPQEPKKKRVTSTQPSGEPLARKQVPTRSVVHPHVQAGAILTPIAISHQVLDQAQKKMTHRPGLHSRSSLFFRLALYSLVEQRKHTENVLEKREIKKTERQLRSILKEKGIFYTIVTENHQKDIPYTVEISTYKETVQAA